MNYYHEIYDEMTVGNDWSKWIVHNRIIENNAVKRTFFKNKTESKPIYLDYGNMTESLLYKYFSHINFKS